MPVSYSADFDAEEFSEWLVGIAVRVDELVAQKVTLERFRRMLRDWKAEHEAGGPKSSVDKRGRIQYNPVEILPRRRLSLYAMYAVLAAIHDVICEKAKRIDPWATHKRLRNTGFPKAKAGTSYQVLCIRVSDLTIADRQRIEEVLDVVTADLVKLKLLSKETSQRKANAAIRGIEATSKRLVLSDT